MPTLATKADLVHLATKQDLERTHVIVESLRDDIHKVADGVASHAVKIQKIEILVDGFALHAIKLDAIGLALKSLAERLDNNSDKLSSLTDRLAKKGVI